MRRVGGISSRRTWPFIVGLFLVLTSVAQADTVLLRSDGKAANDNGDWTWTGTELGDVSDATFATTNKANRQIHSTIANDAAYTGCTINSVQVNIRAAQTTGNELLDYGFYDSGTTLNYYTGSPVQPLTTGFLPYSNTWSTRPWGGAWTDADIDALVVAGNTTNSGKWDGEMQLAEVWAVVDYTCVSNTPPTVTITGPGDASNFDEGQSINFTGTASDTEDGDITANLSWDSNIDGVIGTGGTFARSDLSVGTHTITASVTDSGSLSGNDQITLTVNNVAPTVTITSPADPSSFSEGANITFTATATDPGDGDLAAGLAWTSSIDGAIGSGGSFSRSDLSVGTHTITASVTDSNSAPGQDQITVTINANTAPTATITAPGDASNYNQGDNITFTGTASDAEDGDLTTSLAWTSSIDGAIGTGGTFARSDLSPGSHTITASVTDSGSLVGQDQITITVNGPPTVTITAPTTGANFDEGANVSFTGTATDVEDGVLTASLAWTSSLDGAIGTGGSFSRSDLSIGTHTINASVTDSGGLPGQDQITVTINAVANDVSPGTPTANIDNCNQITVTAPFTNDDNGNSTTLFERSPNGTDSWTAVTSCGAGNGVVSGPSPRTCVDTTVADNSINYYRIDFTDGDGVNPPDPQTIGPYDTTPFCGDNSTTVGTAEAEASSCNQVTVIARFTGDANLDGSILVEYSLTGQATWVTGCAAVSGPSPRQCVIPALAASTGYDIQITFTDPDGVAPDNNLDANNELITPTPATVTTSACGADTAAPTILFLAPARDAIMGGTDTVKVQVFDTDLASLTVQYSVDSDGDANLTAISQNANYDCGTNCAVYEFNLNTTALSQGAHFMTIKATDTEGNIARLGQGFQVNNTGSGAAGSGLLLRRTHGSQVCVDCHNLPTHSSQSTSTKYGNWAMDCVACHTPHMTQNIFLISPQIRTPNSGLRDVRFETTVGAVADSSVAGTASYANEDNATQADGPCQVCHTRTKSAGGDARWRNAASGGNVDTHYASASTSDCIGCHTHDAGFSGAGGACDSCHFAPPTVGKHGSHDEIGGTPTDYANLTPTTTPTQYGFACGKCHTGGHFNDPAKPHTVEVIFDDTQDPKNPTGTYASDAPSQATDPGVNGDGWYWSDGDCSNLYCHSNAQPLGGLTDYGIVTWDQAAAVTCADCHNTQASDDTGGTNIDLSDSHGKHIQSQSGETGTYTFKCDECHAQTIKDSPADPWNLSSADFSTAADQGKVQHADGGKDVFFSATATAGSVDQSGGTYAGTPNHNCSDTYCHSQGTSTVTFAAPNDTALGWNGGTSNCRSCHSGDATAAPTMATGAHGGHVNNAATIGTNYECSECHSSTVGTGNNELITSYTNHVDGSKTVAGAKVDSPYSSPNCAAAYCHSSGQGPSGTGTSFEYYSMNWNTDTIADCKGCHGKHSENAFTSTAGEPNYTNDGAGTPDANSHQRHVASAADCTNCHNSTTSNGTQILASAPHTDQTRDIAIAPGFDTGDPNYTVGSKTCQNVACHGSGMPQWGGTLVCLDCHDGPDGGTLGDGTPNGVGDEWNNGAATGPGHGTTGYGNFATTGGTNPSTMAGCDYCHDLGTSHTPTATTNPYRIRFSTTDNTLCLQCHAAGDLGISQNSEGTSLNPIDSSLDIDTAHFGTKHADGEGGQFCWDCHDPHGVPSNILMTKSQVSITTLQTGGSYYGVPDTTGTVDFTARADYTDFVKITGTPPRTGMCQACHDPTKGADSTKYWRWDGNDNDALPSDHNATPGKPCTDCHAHTDNFKGAGSCLECHASHIGPTGVTVERTQIIGGTAGSEGDDFIRQSRHVSDGTTTSIVTDFDCIVCHAEGDVSSTTGDIKTNPTYHGADGGSTTVDLRDVDAESGAGVAAAWPGSRVAGELARNATYSTARDGMDSFCMGCHDSDTSSDISNRGGAWGVAVNSADSGLDAGTVAGGGAARRLTPFNTNDNLTNAREIAALDTWRTTNNQVTDVRGQFNYQNLTGKAWASHHNLNQFTKRYGTTNVAGWGADAWTAYVTTEGDNIGTAREVAGLHCSDCHLNEANAHGTRNTWYMLSNSSGNDTLFANVGTTTSTGICSKCHDPDTYGEGNTSTASRVTAHNASGDRCNRIAAGDVDGFASLGWDGTAAGTDQLTCLGCHGGLEPGMIHGTNSTYVPGGATASEPRYRFMGTGGSMRYYNPADTGDVADADWAGTVSDVSCYTIGAADTFGACDQHSSAVTPGPATRSRPLDY